MVASLTGERGRPRKTSQELRDSGSKPSVWKRRLAEEQAAKASEPKPPPQGVHPETLAAFLTALNKEARTFGGRLIPGQTVASEYGARFNWRRDHPLTTVRTFAEQVASGKDAFGPMTTRICKRFLADLVNGHERGFYLDPVAAGNASLWFLNGNFLLEKIHPAKLLPLVQIISWKTSDGAYRFNESWWPCAGQFEELISNSMTLNQREELQNENVR
jgi:hypothetical protein